MPRPGRKSQGLQTFTRIRSFVTFVLYYAIRNCIVAPAKNGRSSRAWGTAFIRNSVVPAQE